MTSSTEALSAGSVHECVDSQTLKCTPPRRQRRSPPSSPNQQPSEEIQHEIEEFLDDVPEVKETFLVTDKIGSGTFSSVYVGRVKNIPQCKQQFALKHIIPTSHPSRIESELRCLQEIGGEDNVMGVKACLRHKDHVVIVMPYFEHERFQDYVQHLTLGEVQLYMKNLLISLARVHKVDIIHRDVKPSNFLYNRKTKQYALVDFGLAQKAPVPLNSDSSSSDSSIVKDVGSDKPSSQRKTRSHSLDHIPNESKKRKLAYGDPENKGGSPKKMRILSDGKAVKVPADTDLNVQNVRVTVTDIGHLKTHHRSLSDSRKPQLRPIDTNTLPLPGSNAFISKSKSPRRALLTKRTLAHQQEESTVKSTLNRLRNVKAPMRRTPIVVEKDGKSMYKSIAPTSCQCYAKPSICSICISRSSQHAPRAGTPGFRAPEVLMKYPDQTTAVDIWSAGVIFLSLLSGRYPFFKANDDMTALAQIIALLGSEKVKAAAKSYGKNLICSPEQQGHDLPDLVRRLRGISDEALPKVKSSRGRQILQDDNAPPSWVNVPKQAYQLLEALMDLNPNTRLSAEEALKHEFFTLKL